MNTMEIRRIRHPNPVAPAQAAVRRLAAYSTYEQRCYGPRLRKGDAG